MKNFETGTRLLKEAEEIGEELKHAYEKKLWNLVIRRAQEVVELSLKGVLKNLSCALQKN